MGRPPDPVDDGLDGQDTRPTARASNTDRGQTASFSIFDLFLALLPVPMIAGALAGRLTAAPTNLALFLGAVLTVCLAAWGLFWHYPA